jgi:hypothetical protein
MQPFKEVTPICKYLPGQLERFMTAGMSLVVPKFVDGTPNKNEVFIFANNTWIDITYVEGVGLAIAFYDEE